MQNLNPQLTESQALPQSAREITVSTALPSHYFRGLNPRRCPQRAYVSEQLTLACAQVHLLVVRQERGLPMNAASLRRAARLLDKLAELAA